MARRNSTTQPENSEATVADQENTEAPTTEPTETPTEGADGKAEVEIDLTAFKEAAEAAVAKRDESTGEIPLAEVEPVNVQYRALDGIKPKNAAKNWLEDEMKAAITKLNVQLARAYSIVRDNLSAGTGTKSEKQPADPTAAYVNKVAAHVLALDLIRSNVPEDVDTDKASGQVEELVTSLKEQVDSYQAWVTNEAEDKGEAPEVSPVVRTAFKLAQGKASGGGRVSGGSGVRRDIGKHIQSAFADLEDGAFLSIAQIANHTSEEYGQDHPSQGAVSARLFPASGGETTVPGVRKAAAEGDRPRGAVKDVSKS